MPGQQAGTPADTRFYAVSYVEAMVSSTGKAIALLKQYRDTSAKQDGFVSIELFEQLGRPGHFALFEVWRDQKALDLHVASPHARQYRDTLQPMTGSPLDERVYKPLD